METRAQKIGAQRGTTCTVRIEGNTAYFFEEKHTKPDLAKVSLKAMHEQATAKGVPLREIEPTDVIPPELAQLVQRAKAGDSAAIRQLKADYIHTSHRPVLTMSDLAHAPEPSGVRTVFPNQPGRAVIGQPVMARSSK